MIPVFAIFVFSYLIANGGLWAGSVGMPLRFLAAAVFGWAQVRSTSTLTWCTYQAQCLRVRTELHLGPPLRTALVRAGDAVAPRDARCEPRRHRPQRRVVAFDRSPDA